jgi:hypothetical protein
MQCNSQWEKEDNDNNMLKHIDVFFVLLQRNSAKRMMTWAFFCYNATHNAKRIRTTITCCFFLLQHHSQHEKEGNDNDMLKRIIVVFWFCYNIAL